MSLLGFVRVYRDGHSLVHFVLDVLAGRRFHLVEVDGVVATFA